ncbi:MAG TPA: DPP IV N-terminal domain-containing protein, partial [Gammaproteobacteria bacterium]|nr:DPP IV N-terminal domain-containing protein [Gammaproteobacteria bacterium]
MRRFLPLALLGFLTACAMNAPVPDTVQNTARPTPAKTYTIKDIFAEPGLTGYYPESMQWQPKGNLLTYLLRDKNGKLADLYALNVETGERSVLIDAQTLAGAARPDSEIEDTQEQERISRYNVASYHWSPKGNAILFSAGEQLELYSIASGQSRVITQGAGAKRNPQLSPDQQWISYVTDGNLYYAPLKANGTGQGRPVADAKEGFLNGWLSWVYREELGLRSAYEWSPSSRYIAFMQFDQRAVQNYPLVDYLEVPPTVEWQKYPKAGSPNPAVKLGVHDVQTGRTEWIPIASGEDILLTRIGWVPNTDKLYALVMNRGQTQATLYLSDVSENDTKVLTRISDPYWIDLANLHFLEDGRFIWPNQTDGWTHLQLYSASGEKIRTLTPGKYNVTNLAGVNEQSGWVYFTRYTNGGLYQQLYRVKLSGGEPEPVTRQAGVHSINMGPDAKYMVEYYSNAMTPTRVTLRHANGTPVKVLREPNDMSAYGFVEPRIIQFTAADGETQLYGSITVPPNFDPDKKYPVIMYQYGGPGAGTLVQDSWDGSRFLFHQLLARDGFIIFQADNSLAGQFSHTQQGKRKYNFGEIELADQLAAVEWLKNQPYVDDSNIGIWGWSYGGYMTAYELINAPGVWDAGISGAPVTRWEDYDTIYTERYMGTPQEHAEAYKQSSTLTNAGQMTDTLLLVHGTGDDNVHFQNIHHLVNK